jgi:hypothetical protein
MAMLTPPVGLAARRPPIISIAFNFLTRNLYERFGRRRNPAFEALQL